ncbi:MAG: hypothetical protein AAB800_05060 [Patescibacteria group bacterium]
MPDVAPLSSSTEPVPSVMPSVLNNGTVVVPPEAPKKGPGLLWLAVIFGVAIIGGLAYFYYAGQQKQVETVANTPPSLINGSSKPNQGFDASIPTPTPTTMVTPTLSSSDSITDIEKDLNTTTIESGNSSEFTTDLQGL